MATFSSCDSGSGFADELCRRAEAEAEAYERGQVPNRANLDYAIACAEQIGDYLAKARATQDDGLQQEFLALAQHLAQTIIAALTANAA